jgi:uridine kinase
LIIGICGGTGSGKTTVSEKILEALRDRVIYLQHDYYYRDLTHLSLDDRRTVNYDHPDSLETSLLTEHLQALKSGRAIERPDYDFTVHNRRSQTVRVEPKPVIVVEGILIFESAELRALMDLKVFVDTDADLRFIRRLRRDIVERGRTPHSVMDQYLSTVRPMHLEFVEPSKRYADIIIPEGYNPVSVDLVVKAVWSMMLKE